MTIVNKTRFEGNTKIWAGKPYPSEAAFYSGVPLLDSTTQEVMSSLVLFSPNLNLLKVLDNSGSPASSSYSVSYTQGFTFSTTQSLSIAMTVGVDVEVVTASITTTFGISFTEQWDKSTTKSWDVSVPANSTAFIYQGWMYCQTLGLEAKTGEFAWQGDYGKCDTSVLKTSAKNIVAPVPPNEVSGGTPVAASRG